MLRSSLLTLGLIVLSALNAAGADGPGPLYPPAKVPLTFDRLYDYPELADALKKLVTAHPDLLELRSLGKSYEGRDLWCVVINDPKTGGDRSKPAMYVDGNIHGNEVQAAEACLYLIWYLTENAPRVPKLREMLRDRAFYVVPTVNPDGRAHWFSSPNTSSSSRSGKVPRDDDRDGVADEDGVDDLNGDGHITQMRRRNPRGRFKVSNDDPRILVPVQGDEPGQYELLGQEGIDNDGDGDVNEDPPGGYDMNRNWPADWQPNHIQSGAGDFPLSWPETRAIAAFVLDHPNIAGVQAFHNAGGMILRGPSHSSRQDQYPPADERVASAIGAVGARMLPFYRNMQIERDLYAVRGGFVGWTYEHLGIFSFTNELWNNAQLLGRPEPPSDPNQTLARAVGATDQTDQLFANDRLMFGAQFLPWTPAKHPIYGDIEIGGFVKQSQRVPPPFLIEEMCHRNAAFVLYHADQMPLSVWNDVELEPLGEDTYSVTAEVRNTRKIPTIAAQAARRRIGLPDVLTLDGSDLEVISGGIVRDRDTNSFDPVERHPERLELTGGISGESSTRVRWIVRAKGEGTVRYRSQKGGSLTRTLKFE